MKGLWISAALLLVASASSCGKIALKKGDTILLGGTYNMNTKCIGHMAGLCGTENNMLPVEIAGVFATESDCHGLRLRGLSEQERGTPANQLPLLLEVYYEGSRHTASYMGTGKGEDEGWMILFNGPKGHFSATVRTEREAIRRVCLATKGSGGEVDENVGYTH